MSKKLNFFLTKFLIESYFIKGKVGSIFKEDLYEKLILKALEFILNTYKSNTYPVLSSFFVPAEIFHVFKMAPISCEYIAPLLAVSDKAVSVLEATEKEGFSTDLCSFHRAVLGAYLKGYLPKYKLIVATSHLCDGQNKTLEEIALREKIPYFLLDVPQEYTKEAIHYLASQIKELCDLLTEITGFSPSPSDWRDVLSRSNNTRDLMIKFNKLRYELKGNIFGQKAFNLTLLSWLMLGTEFLENFFKELTEKIEKEESKKDGFKIIWLLSYPYYVGNFAEKMEEKNLFVVGDELSYVFWEPLDPDRPFESLSKKILKNPNLGSIENRLRLVENLVKESKAEGVIHFSHWGCRQGCGGVKAISDLLSRLNVPFLEIHGDCIDKRHKSKGQIETRLQSFVELLSQKRTNTKKGKNISGFFLGIDIGSLTTKAVIIDEKDRIVFKKVIYTGSSSKKTIKNLEKEIFSYAFKGKIKGCVSTGYGRFSVEFADENISEITCHAKGIAHEIPGVKTLIDIGGQDTKVISLDENGNIIRFIMNDKCAAGTGRFLEIMAKAIEVDVEELGLLSVKSKNNLSISSMCSVFAESEVISLIADNVKIEDIAKAICQSIAKRTASMVERLGKSEKIAMSGGVAKNIGVVKELERILKARVYVPSDPQIIGALGAALIAKERSAK